MDKSDSMKTDALKRKNKTGSQADGTKKKPKFILKVKPKVTRTKGKPVANKNIKKSAATIETDHTGDEKKHGTEASSRKRTNAKSKDILSNTSKKRKSQEDTKQENEKENKCENKVKQQEGGNSRNMSRVDAYIEERKKRSKESTDVKQKDRKSKEASEKKSEIIEQPRRMHTRSQGNLTSSENIQSNDDTKSASEKDDEEEIYFMCKVCQQCFTKHTEYKKHKVTCTTVSKKHTCSKCYKSFSQQSLLNQHFDYRHTDKPKRFVCTPCGKSFELKKSWQEHNHRLHDDKGKKYLCDFCSRSFYHFSEFTLHRASHTGLKPFKCVRCGEASFTSAERLTKHLKRCGVSANIQCNKCGKGYADDLGLAKHIKDVHDPKNKWVCPFCNLDYNSEGGWYGHLRIKHGVGRNGKKLSTALIEQLSKEETKKNEPTNSEKENSHDEEEEDLRNDEPSKTDDEHRTNGKEVCEEGKSSKDMSHKCPFPDCNELELPNEEEYFKHLWEKHRLGRNQ